MNVSRVAELWRGGGIRKVAAGALSVTVFPHLRLFLRPLTGESSAMTGATPEVLTLSMMDAYARSRPPGAVATAYERLERGDECVLLRVGDEVVCSAWHAFDVAWIEYLDLSMTLSDREVYRYDIWTPPAHRQRRYAWTLLTESTHRLLENGRSHLVSGIHPTNDGGMALPGTLGGAGKIGIVGVLNVGPWRKLVYRPSSSAAPRRLWLGKPHEQ